MLFIVAFNRIYHFEAFPPLQMEKVRYRFLNKCFRSMGGDVPRNRGVNIKQASLKTKGEMWFCNFVFCF